MVPRTSDKNVVGLSGREYEPTMTRRSSSPGPKRRHSRKLDQRAILGSPLEVIGDAEGSATLGWVADGVFYARFVGGLSAKIGVKYAARLQELVNQVSSLQYFSDASALQTSDLLARSAFTRVVLANRRKFTSIVLLTWPDGITQVTRAFAAAIGEPVDVLTDPLQFEKRLIHAAPLAKHKLDPKAWVRTSASIR